LLTWFRARPEVVTGIGLWAGLLSQWLFSALDAAGLPAVLLETRHVRAAFKTMSVKTDRKDVRGIAQLIQSRLAPLSSKRLRRRIQLRPQAEDPQRPHAIRVHLLMLG
jgi:transposase